MSRLFINNIPSLDRLVALEYGRVDDGHDPKNFVRIHDLVWMYLSPEERTPIGFSVIHFSTIDINDTASEVLWESERFDAPSLGLVDASIGEIIASVQFVHGDEPTLNRIYFERATGLEGQAAVDCWRMCLQSGDNMAHFGLGCALYDQGEYREAFQRLRYYAQISPIIAWNWRWYGAAAEAIGETAEARKAYEEAIRLNEEYCQEETDAIELLERLGSS